MNASISVKFVRRRGVIPIPSLFIWTSDHLQQEPPQKKLADALEGTLCIGKHPLCPASKLIYTTEERWRTSIYGREGTEGVHDVRQHALQLSAGNDN